MNQQWRWVVITILILSLAGLACNAVTGGGNEPAATAAAEDAVNASNDAPAGDTDRDDGISEGPETLDLSTLNQGLDTVNSYHIIMNMTFEGTNADGTVERGTVNADVIQQVDPPASRTSLTIEGEEDLEGLEGFVLTQIGETVYTDVPGLGCLSSDTPGFEDIAGDMPFADLLESDDIVGDVRGAQRVLPDEVINGVDSYHFVFDETAVPDSGVNDLDTVNGDIYIAKEGNYLVRLVMEGTGRVNLFDATGELQTGSVTIQLDVLDVNQPVNVEAPQDCGSLPDFGDFAPGLGGEDAAGGDDKFPLGSLYPVMPEPQQLFVSGDITSYQLPGDALDSAVQFYQAEMPADGWETVSDGTVFTEDAAVMKWIKEGTTVFVTISVSADTTFVQVVPE